MILLDSIQTAWQATAPWYKTGLLPIIEIINKRMNDDDIDTNGAGMIFLCEDGGYDACIELWQKAKTNGMRFVNPAPFPYSLSSSPAGFVAKACGICGPVIILVEKEGNSCQEELAVYAQHMFLQQVTHLFVVNASLYDKNYAFSATVHLYSG